MQFSFIVTIILDHLFSVELSGSRVYMEDAGGMIEEHLQTELDDNGRMNLQH